MQLRELRVGPKRKQDKSSMTAALRVPRSSRVHLAIRNTLSLTILMKSTKLVTLVMLMKTTTMATTATATATTLDTVMPDTVMPDTVMADTVTAVPEEMVVEMVGVVVETAVAGIDYSVTTKQFRYR